MEDKLAAVLSRIRPAEILLPERLEIVLPDMGQLAKTRRPDWHFSVDGARLLLREHFHVHTLDAFGIERLAVAIAAAGALLQYARATQASALPHLMPPKVEEEHVYLGLDPATRRNLELTETLRGQPQPTLFSLMDVCVTGMGARLLRHALHHPLRDPAVPIARQVAVEELLADNACRVSRLRLALKGVADVERIAGRIALLSARPRDLSSLRDTLGRLSNVVLPLTGVASEHLVFLAGELSAPPDPLTLLTRAIAEEPSTMLRDGGVIAPGFDAELDDLRMTSTNCGAFLLAMEQQERERTGIPNLKVEFNRVHGFYIEITRANLDRVPAGYQRRQTLKNVERFITPELKAFEDKALSAQEKSLMREKALFEGIVEALRQYLPCLQAIARALAALDMLAAFASIALDRGWSRPRFTDKPGMTIEAGRHPVVENEILMTGKAFIANDVTLHDNRRLLLITGPNMGGKSTLMRQTALIALLARVGSFVPAAAAVMGPLDRIFTRIGASDDLAAGHSTFMVEMTEAAAILHQATAQSLVLMDEIGRGTSTFDGLALAFAICRQLLDRNCSLTLFATHYFELTGLAREYPSLANVHLDAVEHNDRIVFLHALEEGPANQSYGIQVAALAGMPAAVVRAAKRELRRLEERAAENAMQPDLFSMQPAVPRAPEPHPALEALMEIEPDGLTPREALKCLYALKDMMK
jgi:DNA mismatch repair protein MutS